MAPSFSSSPSPSPSPSSSKSPPAPPPSLHQPHHITPIQECEREEQEDATPTPIKHHPTPLHQFKNGRHSNKKRQQQDHHHHSNSTTGGEDGSVSCNKCRPHAREKISVVPLDNNNNNGSNNLNRNFIASPNVIFKYIFSSLTRKSPKSTDASPAREEQWKTAVAELSHKLIQATRKRDEAILESSRLKYSMAELEKKLNKLEIYCHNLKSGLDGARSINNGSFPKNGEMGVSEKLIVEQFLVSVSESRASVRVLSRALTLQLKNMGGRVFEKISLLLQPYEIKISFSKNPKGILFYLEALLNKAFFEDFESVGFQKSAVIQILNPIDRCEANYASFNVLKELTWDEVLDKGTRHFSEEFSKFCDRKMSEIVAMLGWNRAWPEPLLQAFFGASKNVWLVHLLANSVHPGFPIFRVDAGVRFDSVYMEDMGGDRAKKLVPTLVRIMVAPGFYVYGNLVKCKVLCRYYNNNNNNNNSDDKGLSLAPSP